MNIINELANPITMSGELSVKYYTRLWLSAYPRMVGSGNHTKYFKMRLKELESWDTSNNKPNERAGKIAALKILIEQ